MMAESDLRNCLKKLMCLILQCLNAQNDEDEIEFGDFMRACAIYCFFGREEILKFLYVYADKQKIGRITHDQFIALLNDMHPFDKTRAKRALKELVMVPGKEMDFYEFKDICAKFPALVHPMLNMQFVLREHVCIEIVSFCFTLVQVV